MDDKSTKITLTAGIVAAYVSNNTVALSELPALIKGVHDALASTSAPLQPAHAEPAVKATAAQIRKSITPDALISFVDGKPYKTLRRHLSTHGFTVDSYKAQFGLPSDYPTVAPLYSQARSAMAKALGLGQGGRTGKGAKAKAKKA